MGGQPSSSMAGDNPLQPFDGVYAVDSSHLEVSGGLGDTCRKPLQEPLCSSSKGFGGGAGILSSLGLP